MTVLITGATGTIGSEIVRGLARRGVTVRALVRDSERASALLGLEAELTQGDFADTAALAHAVQGVNQVFLSSPNHPEQAAWESAVIDAACAAGVRRIVKLSALGAEVGSEVAFWDAHGRIEEHLRSTGVRSVLLKPTFYMSGVLACAQTVRQAGAVFLPGAGAKVAMVNPADVAEAAVAMLVEGDRHDGKSYQLTGPEALTFDDVAAGISTVAGRTVAFVPVSDQAAYDQLVGAGLPEWFASNLVKLFELLRAGAGAHVTDDVHRLTGRPARTLTDFLQRHAPAFA